MVSGQFNVFDYGVVGEGTLQGMCDMFYILLAVEA